MDLDRDNIRFNVLRNALYHTARRLTYERWARWLNLVVVLLGAAAMGDLFAHFGLDRIWAGFGVAFAGAIQLVFDFNGAARDHQALQRDYYNLLADVEAAVDPDKEAIARFYSRMIRITGEERPTMKAVDARAYNDAIDATGIYLQNERLIVPWLHRVTANWIARSGYEYRKRAEITPPTNL